MNYMTQRAIVNKNIEKELPVTSWIVSISKDAKQFLIRFPRETEEILGLKKGLIAVVVETFQCYLTNEGLDFIKNNLSIYNEVNTYKF